MTFKNLAFHDVSQINVYSLLQGYKIEYLVYFNSK